MDTLTPQGKPFVISKWEVWEAYRQVKANKGAPGVDGCSLEDFEKDLKGNLYKIWNRMSSGSYLPPPVLAVEIPKPHGGGTRVLGVPTIADRIAQTVVARRLEEAVEPSFHPDSYGYRPGRSALDAVAVCRRRCWAKDWVIDLDVERFFDSVPWELLVKAVAAHTDQPWVVLYVRRWLQAPLQHPDGTVQQRDRGTPAGLGGLARAGEPVHARRVRRLDGQEVSGHRVRAVRRRRRGALRRPAPGQDAGPGDRRQDGRGRAAAAPGQDPGRVPQRRQAAARLRAHRVHLLGFTFRARGARSKHRVTFTSFLPAISKHALGRLSAAVRRWRRHRWTGLSLTDVAQRINLIVRGWMQYYGAFYRTALYLLLQRIDTYLVRWLGKKHKRLRPMKKAKVAWRRITSQDPRLFTPWAWAPASWWSR